MKRSSTAILSAILVAGITGCDTPSGSHPTEITSRNPFAPVAQAAPVAPAVTVAPVAPVVAAYTPGVALARQLNDAFAAVADEVSPCVVIVEVTEKPLAGRRGGFSRPQQGEGSGIIVTEDGFILTNNHVVDNAATNGIIVELQNGQKFSGRVVGTDAKSDIAVVKIDPKGTKLKAARLGDSSKLRVGEFVVAIGHPLDLTYSVTVGHVSALQRLVPDDSTVSTVDEPEYIQTDAVINPGNSGGPLINLDGEVIGINDMIEAYTDSFSGGTVNLGIGLAIPVNQAKAVKDILISRGKFVRSRIGIQMGNPDVPELLAPGLKPVSNRPTGIEVEDITSGSPASRSGLKTGDIIVAVDDIAVSTARELYHEISFKPPGQTIAVNVMRNGKPFSFKVTTEAAPEELAANLPDTAPSLTIAEVNYGFSVRDLTKDLANKFGVTATSGLIVTAVQPRGMAYGNFATGDVIIQFNGKPVPNAKAFVAALDALKPGQQWTISLAPKGNEDPPFIVLHDPR